MLPKICLYRIQGLEVLRTVWQGHLHPAWSDFPFSYEVEKLGGVYGGRFEDFGEEVTL